MLNVYELDIDRVRVTYRCLRFEAYDEAWLNFIANSRKGLQPWQDYDFIEGGVADDRVVDTVNLYLLGLERYLDLYNCIEFLCIFLF